MLVSNNHSPQAPQPLRIVSPSRLFRHRFERDGHTATEVFGPAEQELPDTSPSEVAVQRRLSVRACWEWMFFLDLPSASGCLCCLPLRRRRALLRTTFLPPFPAPMTQIKTVGPSTLRATIRALLDRDTGPWVSLYAPVDRAWNKTPTNRARLRSLIDEARDQAAAVALSTPDMEALLAPVTALRNAPRFWQNNLSGVAAFSAPDAHVALRLPFAPTMTAAVDPLVHVRPLWRYLEPNGTFYALGLSAGGVALFRGSRHHMEPVPLDDGPTSLDDVLQFDEHIQSLRYHTKTPPGSGKGGRRSAIFYGHEDAGDRRYVKEGVLRFFRALDNEVRAVVESVRPPPPLVLAGVEELRGLYRQVNKYAHLLDEAVETSVIEPESRTWDADALHRRAWTVVRPRFDEDREDARNRFESQPERTAANPGSALLAATAGRVEALFVAERPRVWGTLNDDRHAVQQHDERAPGDIEFLNAAAVRTLQTSGTVYVSEAAEVPAGGPIAALLRY